LNRMGILAADLALPPAAAAPVGVGFPWLLALLAAGIVGVGIYEATRGETTGVFFVPSPS
jgi:hypothetical protein